MEGTHQQESEQKQQIGMPPPVETNASPTSTRAATPPRPPQPLLSRWEEVLLADTLRFSLDPAVARAKRVLHMVDLEKELREEGRQERTWWVSVCCGIGVA